MSGPAETAPRRRLLDATVDYLGDHGAAGVSLRQVAAGIGTSHRMLIYHFGSKEGLLVAVVQAMEAQQREVFDQLTLDQDAPPGQIARAFWRHLRDPALRPYVRLFFEMYGKAVQGHPRTVALLDGLVEAWLEPLTAWGARHGIPAEQARAYARLGIATPRGLLLDLLATGDEDGVDAAMESFIAAYEALWTR
ncbi:MAG: TetR/AcrR family transcriptional regulator [Streptosporangiaceae bacterium]